MYWTHLSYLLANGIASVIALFLVLYLWRRRSLASAFYLMLLMAALTVWSTSVTFEYLGQSVSTKVLWSQISYIGIVCVGPLWLLFVVQYGGRGGWFTRGRHIGLWVVPIIGLLLVWTNPMHNMIWPQVTVLPDPTWMVLKYSHGPGVWLVALYSYLMLFAGAAVLVMTVLRSTVLFKSQVVLLLVAAIIPFVSNLLYLLGIGSWNGQDIAPLMFVLSGLLFTAGIFRLGMLDIVPVARDLLIEELVDGVFVLDNAGRVVDLNPAAARLLAHNPRDVMGMRVEQALASWPALLAYFQQGGESHEEIEVRDKLWYDVHVVPVRDRQGVTRGRLMLLREISTRKHAELELRRYTQELEQSNAELDAFAHTVAHDLRNPLAVILGLGLLMEAQETVSNDADLAEQLQFMMESGRTMESIIDALLLHARVRRTGDVPRSGLDMGMIVDKVCSRLEGMIRERQATISLPELWPEAYGYEIWIEEVWVNYLSNALKYGGRATEALAPEITVGYDVLDGGKGYRFWVRDNGPGLNEEERARLFIPFSRLHRDVKDGHGLGLTIVERIVRKLDGEVGVDSVPGAGSTFWFTLPAMPLQVQPDVP